MLRSPKPATVLYHGSGVRIPYPPSNKLPSEALTPTREMNRTAEATRIRKLIIRLLAVELNRRFHSDLPQLPIRMPQIR